MRRVFALGLTGAYTGLALLFTYPLVRHFGTHYVGDEGGDAPIYVWNLWWVKKAIVDLHVNPFHTDYLFYPLGIDLPLHTLAFLHGLVFIPLGALVGPVAGSNLIVLATFPASALATYALARELGSSRGAAFLAGLAFGFCPYRLARLSGHYDLLSTEWLPLYALFFLRAMNASRRPWASLATAGLVAALCGYTSLTYLAFLVLFSVLFLAFRPGRERFVRAVVTGGTAALLLAPLLLEIVATVTAWRYPAYPGAERYGADLLAFALPSPRQNLWGSLGRSFDANLTETTVFPGYLTLAIALSALALPAVRRAHAFWILLGGVSLVLSLGSSLSVAGLRPGVPLPFGIVEALPFLHHLRAPSRFSILLILALSVLLAAAWTHWVGPRARGWQIALLIAATVFLVADNLSLPAPLFSAEVPDAVARLAREKGDFTVAEIPGIDQVPGRIMFHQSRHEKRIFIGTVARVPTEKTAYFFGLPLVRPLIDLRKGRLGLSPELYERERTSAPAVARFLGLRYFLVDPAYGKRGVLDFLEGVLPLEREDVSEEMVVLRVREEELPPLPWTFDPADAASRLYFAVGWSTPEGSQGESFRWANSDRSWIVFRRPSVARLVLVLRLQPFPGLEQAGFEARLDGVFLGTRLLSPAWQEVRFTLPPPRGAVERLELLWTERGEASSRDPGRLAARVGVVKLETSPGL